MKNEVLLVSESTLKSYILNDNIDGSYITPAIRVSQDIELSTAIGPVLLKKLQDLVADGKINDEENAKYKTLLDDYITPYLIWQTMTAIQINLNFKFSNSGMIQNQDERKGNIDYRSGKELMAQYEKYANSYGNKLKKYLCANSNKYPEYRQMENFDGEEDLPLCSIYLGDSRSNKYNYIGK